MGDLAALVMRSGAPQLRLRIAAALALVFVGKLAGVMAPVMLGDAINTLQPAAQGGVALGATFIILAVAFAGLRLVAACAPYARDAIFTRVSQSTMAKAAVETFAHALGLSLDFHQTKQTGTLSRIIDRGARSTDFLIRSRNCGAPERITSRPRSAMELQNSNFADAGATSPPKRRVIPGCAKAKRCSVSERGWWIARRRRASASRPAGRPG
jgi:ABC-type multidrug transport system fused ATPase/permease subunit